MATSELERPGVALPDTMWPRETAQIPAAQYYLTEVAAVLASLKLTVVLFAAAIFLVFVGTLAQVDNDVWEVVRHTYFRVWIANVEFQAFDRLGQMFYKPFSLGLPDGAYLPFPGGKLIGVALLINLIAAHSMRFKIVAKGGRLTIGVVVIALGLLMTYFVIRSGSDQAIESELTSQFASGLWQALRGTLAVVALAGAYFLVTCYRRLPQAQWYALLGIEVLLASIAVWLLVDPSARLDNSGLRILWQLIKGTNPGLVLLAGCFLLFKRRAGIVLLHGGVGLMMLSEILTAMSAHESQMTIPEGGSVNWSHDIRTAELAVTDRSGKDADRVTVVPQPLLLANIGSSARIEHPDLPFKVQVLRWLPNSKLIEPTADASNPATAGAGLSRVAEAVDASTGVETESVADLPSAYVELFSKKTGDSLGTYLVSQWLDDQPVEVDGRKYDLALRFERKYYLFTVSLKDFEFKKYVGTNTAKSYESQVRLEDPTQNVDREIKIWMNNPLRYAGLTFYQSSFDPETEQTTVLQVVKNPGWMAPYVGCMFVLIGMLAHFGLTLSKFLERQFDESDGLPSSQPTPIANGAVRANGRAGKRAAEVRQATRAGMNWALIVPAIVLVVFAGYLLSKTRMPKSAAGKMQIHEFGKLPVQYQGRVKPYDTLARNTLQYLSGKQEVIGEPKKGWLAKLLRRKEKTPAIHWLLDTISGSPAADEHRVFRIENLEVLDTLGLEPRAGSFRYSLNDFRPKLGELDKQARLVADVPEKRRTLYQRKIAELYEKLQLYAMLQQTFSLPQIRMENQQTMMADLQNVQFELGRLKQAKMPLAVPPLSADVHWSGLMEAGLVAMLSRELKQPVNEGTIQLYSMLNAYVKDDAAGFNRQLDEFRRTLAKYEKSVAANEIQLRAAGTKHSEILSKSRVDFEVFFNNFSPFYYAAVLYFVSFVLGAASWLGWSKPLRRASIWLLCFTFVVHSLALWGRIYISGRPPVTNLYSSAVFIGWAGVLIALVLEWIFRLGLGNIVAAVVGFLTLVVAHNLSLDGDTLIVMQAVLDTQFWLATHVVCVTLGYATTFLAGALGIMYVLLAHVFGVLGENERRQLTRMTYGILCFAIFFSFVGTVLGGLWADDSWGRFWGWDPKENGALIIVLYNALVLHARWGGLVKGRGLATLVIGGNIVTTWSWFGVNELGVGLHSYGASESSTAMWLATFALSQLALIALGLVPRRFFERLSPTQSRSIA
ncbi:MAG: cytochrome c biogenesis protein CcsA [Planctomycetes bacterium]|nr:cytochrome c biogenesis protein CcsA [Planctomycetota bacterium]